MQPEVIEFLKESNAIESVYDEDSLKQAIYAWEYIIEQKQLTVHDVLRVHWILMKNQDLLPDEKGFFRRCAVFIGGKQGIHHHKIGKAIEEWIYNMNMKDRGILNENSKDQVSKVLHVQYEKIHPFVDGNGRTGRIFMNWWRINNGLPILVIHEGKEQWEYYKWFD
jgi:Fic family protein